MQRFYISKNLNQKEVFSDEIFHQITRVLRMRQGEKIILFCGDGYEYVYEIVSISKKIVEVQQQEKITPQRDDISKNIILIQALPNKFEKIELIIQKNIEIGIQKIIFFRSDFSQKLFLSEAKKQRFQTIAKEAVEQCGGLYLPEIEFLEKMNFEEIIAKYHTYSNITLHTRGKNEQLSNLKEENIILWIGPEGGWSENEINKMEDYLFIIVRFGKRILRTETAGMVVNFGLLHI